MTSSQSGAVATAEVDLEQQFPDLRSLGADVDVSRYETAVLPNQPEEIDPVTALHGFLISHFPDVQKVTGWDSVTERIRLRPIGRLFKELLDIQVKTIENNRPWLRHVRIDRHHRPFSEEHITIFGAPAEYKKQLPFVIGGITFDGREYWRVDTHYISSEADFRYVE